MPDNSQQIARDEIEELLRQAQAGMSPASSTTSVAAEKDDAMLGQNEIADLFQQSAASAAKSPAAKSSAAESAVASRVATSPAPAKSAAGSHSATKVTGDDIQLLLDQAEQAIASVDNPVGEIFDNIAPFQWRDFAGTPASTEKATLDLLRDVELDIKIELGRTHMYFEDVLKLRKGSVVPLDKLAGDPVDIYVNGRLIARGEVLVLNDNFCVRVAELVSGDHVD
jgi:flagellar motor switch protein FliN/FliY